MSGPGRDDGNSLSRIIRNFREAILMSIVTIGLVLYIIIISIQVRAVIRNSDAVVIWHGKEVHNQDAHRERLERRFDAVERAVTENGKVIERLIGRGDVAGPVESR